MLTISVAIAGYFINYATETWPGTDSAKGAKLLAGAQGAFAMGRFLGSGIMKYTKARYVFGIYLSCCVAFLAASVTQRNQTGIGTYPQRLLSSFMTRLTGSHSDALHDPVLRIGLLPDHRGTGYPRPRPPL